MRPYAGAVGEECILMHDDTRPHTARICTVYLDQEGIEVMDWPPRSLDLKNPIEHMWDILYRRVQGRQLFNMAFLSSDRL